MRSAPCSTRCWREISTFRSPPDGNLQLKIRCFARTFQGRLAAIPHDAFPPPLNWRNVLRISIIAARSSKRPTELNNVPATPSVSFKSAEPRRPWIVACAAFLLVWVVTSTALYIRAARESSRANFQMSIAQAIDRFLAQDLLGRTDPMVAGKPDETLLGALKQAAPDIDRQFDSAPLIAAQLHSTIALALGRRDDTEGAVREFMGRCESVCTSARRALGRCHHRAAQSLHGAEQNLQAAESGEGKTDCRRATGPHRAPPQATARVRGVHGHGARLHRLSFPAT